MVYKIIFENRIDYCTAKSVLDLLQSYEREFDFSLQEVEDIESFTDDETKKIMIKDEDGISEVTLYSLVINDDFNLIASDQCY